MNDTQSKVLLLIVEDDSLQLFSLEDTLVDAGYDVLTAGNGIEAIAAIAAQAEQIRGVITDIQLGEGPNGWDLGRRAREAVANMPVVYVSGDSAQEWASQGVPNSVMLPKPFVSAQIVTAISHLINTAPPA